MPFPRPPALVLPALCLAWALSGCSGGGERHKHAPPPSRGLETREPPPLYDFLANRPLAHIYEEGALIIDAAAPDIYKYIDGGWKASLLLGERDRGDRAVALADGQVAVLRLGGVPAAATQLLLWLRPAPDVPMPPIGAGQAMTVLLNERPLSTLPIPAAAEYGLFRAPIAAGRLLAGENQLRLFFRSAGTLFAHRSAAAFELVVLGGPGPLEAPAGERQRPAGRSGSYGIGADARPALIAARPTRWSYYIVPPQGPLRLLVSLGAQTAAAPVEWILRAARDGEPEKELSRERAQPGTWRELDVDLAAIVSAEKGRRSTSEKGGAIGAALRLDLILSGPGALGRPRIVGAPPPAPAAPGLSPPRAEHVVVFAVDALRADRLRAGPAGAFAGLLSRGVRLRATAPGNFPLPGHASLLSGTYPALHRLVKDDSTLDKGLPLLQEILSRAGFATGLFSGSGYVSERWGLSRGFDTSRNLVREGLPSASPEVWKLARPWLEAQHKGGRRIFLYLASADPHAPYTAPPGFVLPSSLKGYGGPLRGGVTAQKLLQIRKGQLRPSAQDRAYLEALYDADVAQSEATLAALLAELARLGIADKTAVLLVGSHGEELFDHGSVGHGHSLHGELSDVPLVLSFPARLPAGTAPAVEAELLDLAPTLLHLAGAAVPESMQGESLLSLLSADATPWPRPALAEHGDQLRALSLGRYRLLISSGDRLQLFDRLRDPGELDDLSGDQPIALRALRTTFAILHAQERRWNKPRMGTAASLR